jgi:hypothetical protein
MEVVFSVWSTMKNKESLEDVTPPPPKAPKAWGYNWANLLLGTINTET